MIGVYQAQIQDYGVSTTKANNPQVFITFGFQAEGAAKKLTWYGSFNGGAKDITLKTLIYCGLQPQMFSQLQNLNKGIASNMLDTNKVLNIDVQEEPKQDGKGMRTVIQWINDPNSAPQIKKIDEATNAQFFGTMGFDADLIRLAGELGVPLNNGGQAQMGNMNPNMGNNAPGAMNGQNMNQAQHGQNNMNGGFAQNASHSNQQQQQQQQQQQTNQAAANNQQMPPQGGNGFAAPF